MIDALQKQVPDIEGPPHILFNDPVGIERNEDFMFVGRTAFAQIPDVLFSPGICIIGVIFCTDLRGMSQILNDLRAAFSISSDILDNVICWIFRFAFHDAHMLSPPQYDVIPISIIHHIYAIHIFKICVKKLAFSRLSDFRSVKLPGRKVKKIQKEEPADSEEESAETTESTE